jgi:hypothetical protein
MVAVTVVGAAATLHDAIEAPIRDAVAIVQSTCQVFDWLSATDASDPGVWPKRRNRWVPTVTLETVTASVVTKLGWVAVPRDTGVPIAT